MRTSLSLLLLLLLATPARAEKAATPTHPADVVRELGALIQKGDAPRKAIWDAYVIAKEAIAEADGLAKKDPTKKDAAEEASAAYAAIQSDVATALRRSAVPTSGWMMGIFAALLLWGGFFFCLGVAMRSGGPTELDEDETWPIRPEEP